MATAPSTLVDLVEIYATTTGTGAIGLGSTVPGYRGIEALVNGAQYSYTIRQDANYETGIGTYLSSSRTFTRSVRFSSAGNAQINLSPNAQISFVASAEDLISLAGTAGAATAALQKAQDVQSAVVVLNKSASDYAQSSLASANNSQQSANDSASYYNGIKAQVGGSPISGVLTLQATSRAVMAAITNPTSGTQVMLSELGREGLFTWLTGDRSALISADPAQGLYVAPASDTTGKSGCWSRVLVLPGLPGGMVYRTTWWGVGDGFVDTAAIQTFDGGVTGPFQAVASVTMQSIANLLPDGSVLSFPTGTINIQAVVQFGQKGIITSGAPGLTWITSPAGSACFNDGTGFFRFNGSNSRATGMGFKNLATTQAQVSPAAITFAGGAYANRQGNPVTNIEVDHCIFLDCSAPCIVYDSSWKRGYPDGYQPTKNFHFHHNITRGCDYEYQSLYTADGVWWHDNYVECVYKGQNREFYGFRCIGGTNVHIFDNRIVGPGYARQDARAFNVKSGISYDPNNPIQSINVHIYNNDVQNWPMFCDASASVDRLFITNNRAVNSILPDDNSALYSTRFFNFQNSVTGMGLIVVEDNTIVGYDGMYYLEYSSIREFRWKRNNFRSVGRASQPVTGLAKANGTDFGFFDICDNVVSYPAYNGGTFQFSQSPSTIFGNCWGNVVPEAGQGNVAPIVAGVAGKVVTAPGAAPQDFATVPAIADGTNFRAASGTWAAITRFN